MSIYKWLFSLLIGISTLLHSEISDKEFQQRCRLVYCMLRDVHRYGGDSHQSQRCFLNQRLRQLHQDRPQFSKKISIFDYNVAVFEIVCEETFRRKQKNQKIPRYIKPAK